MKEYQKPEIELLDFTAEPITTDVTIGTIPDLGNTPSPSDNEEI